MKINNQTRAKTVTVNCQINSPLHKLTVSQATCWIADCHDLSILIAWKKCFKSLKFAKENLNSIIVKYTCMYEKKQLKMNIPHYILYMYMKVCLKLREENNSQHTLRKCVSVSGFTRHISVTNETPQTNTPDKRNQNNIWRVYKFTMLWYHTKAN